MQCKQKTPLLCFRLTLALRVVGQKAGGRAATVSAMKMRSKAIIIMGTDRRGQIHNLHCSESWVQWVPGAGEGPRPTRGATTCGDRVPLDASQDAHRTSALKLIPGQVNPDGVLLEYSSP